MTKIRKLISLCLSAAMITAGMVMPVGVNAATGDEVTALSKDGVAFRFALVSDVHIKTDGTRKEYLEKAFETLNKVGDIDAYGLNGDIVWYPSSAGATVNTANYEMVKEIMEAKGVSNTTEGSVPFIASMGNHEFPLNVDDKTICEAYVTAFETYMNDLNTHQEYNGYHVISSGGRTSHLIDLKDTDGDGVGDTLVTGDESLFNTDEDWIMNQIKAIEAKSDYNSNEPIFLMLHHCIQSTTCQYANPMQKRYSTEFKEFLNARPNIVNLVGHTHCAAQYPETIWQDGFTAFQMPVTANEGDSKHQVSFIDVTTDNKVKIYKVDLTTGTYIGEPWVIDIPAGKDGFNYTDAKKANTATPTLGSGAAITVDSVDNYSATISYPLGTCEATGELQDGIVAWHTITVKDKETGSVISSKDYSAKFTTIPQPTTITTDITGLSPGTTYTVSVAPKSIMRVTGSAITTELTTSGTKAGVTLGESVQITFDETLIGEDSTYEKIYNDDSIRIRQGQYYTYTVNVGEDEEITEAGMYQVSHRYAVEKAYANIIMSVKHPDSDVFVPMVKRSLSSTGAHSKRATCAKDDYITLEKGVNVIKVYAYEIDGSDAVDMETPILSKVEEGAIVDYITNKQVYNSLDTTSTDVTGYGSITGSYICTSSNYQNYNMVSFRAGDYIVVPVTVPYTTTYKLEASVKETGSSVAPTYTMKAALGTELLEDWSTLDYEYTMSSNLTTSWTANTLTESVTLQAGTTYYLRIGLTAVGSNKVASLGKIRLTDTGEALSALSVSTGALSPAFSGATHEYTVYASPSSGAVTVSATAVDSTATITGTGSVSVNYGMNNNATVKVTNADGKVLGTYYLHIIAIQPESTAVSLGKTATRSTGENISGLFSGTAFSYSGNGITQYKNLGYYLDSASAYMQIDLGAQYYLNRFYWTRGTTGGGYTAVGLEIQASNDSTFATYDVIGSAKARTIYLDGTNKYQYVRIYRTTGYFYPTKLDIYGYSEASAVVAEDLTTTVTVPSRYYAVGDTVIAAAYDADGRLVSASVVETENAGTATTTLTKENATDTVKVMVWEDLDKMVPRVSSVPVQ